MMHIQYLSPRHTSRELSVFRIMHTITLVDYKSHVTLGAHNTEQWKNTVVLTLCLCAESDATSF